MQTDTSTLEGSLGIILKIKLDIHILYSLAIVLLGIYSKKLKTYIHTKTHRWMFIQVLFIIFQNLKVTKMPFSRWRNK